MKIRNFSAIALMVLSACSSDEMRDEAADNPLQHSPSDEEKRAVRALLIANNQIDATATPQYRATLCRLALEAIEGQMRSALSDEQLLAFAQAKSVYERRAAVDASNAEQSQTKRDVEAAYPEQSERARFAIGCLEGLT